MLRLRHMPTLAAAALEVDRQMGLHELLSSAVLADGREDLSGCVVAAARQKADEVGITQLKAGSTGTPMWIAALLIAGLLPLLYRSSAAASGKITDQTAGADVPVQRAARGTAASAVGAQRRLNREGQTPGASAITVAAASDSQRPVEVGRRPTRSDPAGLSAGGGLAQGSMTAPPTPPAIVAPVASDLGKGSASGSGSAQANSAGADAGIGQVASTKAQAGVANESPSIAQGHGTVNAESFPESYRDVLKAYFAR